MSNLTCLRPPIFCYLVIVLSAAASLPARETWQESVVDARLSQESETSAPAAETASFSRKLLFNGESPTSIDQLRQLEKHFAELADKAKPAVVNIQIRGARVREWSSPKTGTS